MGNIFTFITFAMGISMFFISRGKKIGLMLIGCMLLTLVRIDAPVINNAESLLIVCFLCSEYNNLESFFKRLSAVPIAHILLLSLLSIFIAILFSPHLHTIREVYNFLKSEFFFKYLAIGYAFFSIRNEKALHTVIRFTIFPMIILTGVGVVNLIEGRSTFVNEMMSSWSTMSGLYNDNMGDTFTYQDRFRVQAMFYNPFDYGYICSLCLLLYLYGYSCKFIGRLWFLILSICCGFGIIFCGSRTVVFCTMIEISTYLLLSYNLRISVVRGLFALIIFVLSYFFIPFVNHTVDQMTTMITDTSGREFGGSNLEMRSIQTATVLFYIEDTPLFGRGFHYFNEDLGWGEGGFETLKDSRLFGIEGVYMIYLLERGFVGYFLYLLIWFFLLFYIVRHRSTNKRLTGLGISVFVLYTLFAHMTGELGSVFPTLLVLGCIIGTIENRNKLNT